MSRTPKSKQKKLNALNQKLKVFQEPDPVLSVLQWGVNFTVNELALVAEQPLLMGSHFKASSKISVHNQNYNDQYLPAKYKFKEYCPVVFRELRMRFGEDPEDMLASVCDSPLLRRPTTGKSNANFFFTEDGRLALKTLSKEELVAFHASFPAYHAYIVERNGVTALPHYLGLYRVTVHEKETYIVLMNNVFTSNIPMMSVYDLKGSTVDRSASEKELAKDSPVLKDNDYIASKQKIKIGMQAKAELMERLKADTEFLKKQKYMDYSLLVGIHEHGEEGIPEEDQAAGSYTGLDSKSYFLGIIDVLTKYGAKKIAAHKAKGFKHGRNAEISTINPEQYQKRFLEFIGSIIE